jgi:uncharacterized membrane-anchored protein
MCSPLRRKTLRLLQKHFRQLSPPLSGHGSNDTVAIWCGATTVEEESAHRLAIDHAFADNAGHIFWGFVMFRAIFAAWISFVVGAAVVADTSAAEAQNKSELLRSLHFQKGSVSIGDSLASIALSDKFVYLDSEDAKTFLTKIWENPPAVAARTLGMLLPTDANPLSAEGWGIIISYDKSGYVSDEDAEKINYTELLRDMQEATRQVSAERAKEGYAPFELIGWARQPYYDKSEKKLYWAKRLKFGDAAEETLNYEIRILGRRGVLNLNVVAEMSALAQIDRAAPNILSMVSFKQGNLYSEFNPSIDEAAAYGLAGLIAGGLLTKAGFFKGLMALVLASKKLSRLCAPPCGIETDHCYTVCGRERPL